MQISVIQKRLLQFYRYYISAGQMSLDEMAAKAFRVSSYTSVGHLVHINLRDPMLEFKKEIGQTLLKRVPNSIAVVNKLNTIDNEYRNFDIEVIAKRDDCTMSDEEVMITEVNENKCRFKMDFSKVYWNSRLGTEHSRILDKLKNYDIVFDLFAGIGPFSVPAARNKCIVYANDLNPESVKWLEVNMTRNKAAKHGKYEIFNMDAREFIRTTMKQKLLDEYARIETDESVFKPVIHILMNLPATAPNFLPEFIGLFRNELTSRQKVHDIDLLEIFRKQSIEHIAYCYCFLKGYFEDPKEQVRNIIEENFGRKLTDDQLIEIFKVRNVAPYKDMYRVEIRLDESILFEQKAPVSIMKTNGKMNAVETPKKVTIQPPNGHKRGINDSAESLTVDGGDSNKRPKVDSDQRSYCSIM